MPTKELLKLKAIILRLGPLCLAACATMVVGGIPPGAFEFHPTVPAGGGLPGGWMVAQVVIQLGHSSPTGPRVVWCDIEIGLPLMNYLGAVSDEAAKVTCAEAADQAARLVLRQDLALSALVCKRFQERMEHLISRSIPGARVTKIQTPGFQPKRFPDGDDVGRLGWPAGPALSSLPGS